MYSLFMIVYAVAWKRVEGEEDVILEESLQTSQRHVTIRLAKSIMTEFIKQQCLLSVTQRR